MTQAAAKLAAAEAALGRVEDGMRVGLGTGTTAAAFIERLAEAVADGLAVSGVPTSVETGLVYTSDAADEEDSVETGRRRLTQKKSRDTHRARAPEYV